MAVEIGRRFDNLPLLWPWPGAPHTQIGGETGSGKSGLCNSIIGGVAGDENAAIVETASAAGARVRDNIRLRQTRRPAVSPSVPVKAARAGVNRDRPTSVDRPRPAAYECDAYAR